MTIINEIKKNINVYPFMDKPCCLFTFNETYLNHKIEYLLTVQSCCIKELDDSCNMIYVIAGKNRKENWSIVDRKKYISCSGFNKLSTIDRYILMKEWIFSMLLYMTGEKYFEDPGEIIDKYIEEVIKYLEGG